MVGDVVDLLEVDRTQVAVVGGKAAHLGELARIDGVRVPAGHCVTTDAFRRVLAAEPAVDALLARLAALGPDDREAVEAVAAELRRAVEGAAVPADLEAAVVGPLAGHGPGAAWAVRSSATAEDLPTASFAGQHDTFLDVVGPAAVLRHVRRCWASLFSDRAVAYRLRNGVDHRRVHMAVVVQRMVDARAAGVLFTADPVTSNRKVSSVEATVGLGQALVSGAVAADAYQVRDGEVVRRAVATTPGPLTDGQVLELVRLGRRIEAHLGCPQDVEWCLADDGFRIVQSRPITTLFPFPEGAADGARRVYLSVGHQQMMTDPMKPLGLSLWQLTAARPMYAVGGRLFVDVTEAVASPAGRAGLLQLLGRSDPLMRDALETVLGPGVDGPPAAAAPPPPPAPVEADPALVTELIGRNRASVAALERAIRGLSGPALFDFVLGDVEELRRLLFDPESHRVLMAGIEATWWLNERLEAWLGEPDAADALARSAPHNVTSEMGLAMLDVADVVRAQPEVVAFLQHVGADDDGFLDDLAGVPGGREAVAAVRAFLDEYGARCAGEIDVTRERWSERPATLVPMILADVRSFGPGEAGRRLERGRQEARRAEEDLLRRVRALPDGERRAAEAKAMIDRVRAFIGYREYPKFGMVRRYFVYKQALLAEAERLVRAGVLQARDDAFWLTFQELHQAARTGTVDHGLVGRRREAHRFHQALTPPRVLTSDGECVAGAYRRGDVPAGALVGLPVSAGTAEGRARVVLDQAAADLEPGDILVTPFADPSWTPLLVVAAGLVTEVGGAMTHGAVIAREYGVPAVVAVDGATRLLRDGQRIRVHGTHGYVEVLP